MVKQFFQVLCLVAFFFPLYGWGRDTTSDFYLGQDPPGLRLEVFASGIISSSDKSERSLTLSLQGDELFFARSSGWPYTQIMHMKRQGDGWSSPKVASFARNDWATQPFFSPDGRTLYYSTSRGKLDIRHYSLWRVQKEGDRWSSPEPVIDLGGGEMMEYHPTVTRDGTLYFLYWDFARQTGDIYVSRPVDGRYTDAVNLGAPISTPYNEVRPTADPNGRYLLFESDRPGGFGNTDIYISFRHTDDTWSFPQNLGPSVNTPGVDDTPNLSPDGRYWFSAVNGDIHWMQARAALPDSHGPIRNLASGLRFGTIQSAINFADSGDEIVLAPGIYLECIDIHGKDLVLRSEDPNDPFFIGGTIVQGISDKPVLAVSDTTRACQVLGLTLRAGVVGLKGTATLAAIRNCRFLDNVTHGVTLLERSHPTLDHCLIAGNGQTGITMWPGSGRGRPPCMPQIQNCVIVQNGGDAISGGESIILDSIIEN